MIPRLVYSLLSLCSLAATTTTPRQTDAYTLSYDYSYTYDDDYTYDDYSRNIFLRTQGQEQSPLN